VGKGKALPVLMRLVNVVISRDSGLCTPIEQTGIKFPENREGNREFFGILIGTDQLLFSDVPVKQPFDKKQ
jgi:hypothetical protein